LVLPIVLPVGILAIIATVLYGFSRILLAVSHNAATVTALLVALAIVVVAAVVAGRRYVRLSSLAGMVGAVAGVAMVAGGVAVASLGAGQRGEGGGPSQAITIVAVNLAFEPTTVTVPAGQPFQIVLDNQDAGVQHNVQIFPGAELSGTPLFAGDLVTGPAQITYDVPALDAGTYAFNCVVHPNMTGTIEAVEGGGGGGGGGGEGGGGPSIQVAAENIAFDTDTIELPPDTPATIVFDNRDAGVQHNIAIYEDDTLATVLFQGELVTGPDTIEYRIPPLPAGEYYFHCDVHPNMSGTVVVGGGGGAGGGGGGGGEPPETGPATGPTGAGGGATTTVTAQGIAFDTAEIVVAAGQPSTIRFVNQDAGVQHNISITSDESKTETLFDGELITGPAEIGYQVPALEAGTYYFSCVIHPNMNGVVTVE
jgi:plastocyanin